MGTIEIAVDPILLRLGPLAIRWYGLMIVTGILIGVWLALRWRDQADVSEDDILSLCVWGTILAIVFARLAHVIDRIDYYAVHPVSIVMIQEGGLAIYGAVFGAILAGMIYTRRRKLDFWRLADVASPSLALGMAIGRIGCTINGDAWGAPTSGWGWIYTNPDALLPRALLGVPTQPTPLYEIWLNLGIFALLWAIMPVRRPAGVSFLIFLIVYSVGRFFITFHREDVIVAFDMRQVQLLAIATVLVAAPLLLWRWRQPPAMPSAAQPAAS